MDLSAPPPSPPLDPGLATQHCLTLAIPINESAYGALCGSGGVKGIAELFAGKAKPAEGTAAPLNISPGRRAGSFRRRGLHRQLPDLVVAIYDGEWDPYIDAFLNNNALIDGLNALFLLAVDPDARWPGPGTPINDHWDDFKLWLKRIDANTKGYAVNPNYQPSPISTGPTASEIRNMLPGLPGTSGGSGQGSTGDPPAAAAAIADTRSAARTCQGRSVRRAGPDRARLQPAMRAALFPGSRRQGQGARGARQARPRRSRGSVAEGDHRRQMDDQAAGLPERRNDRGRARGAGAGPGDAQGVPHPVPARRGRSRKPAPSWAMSV